MSTTTTKRTLLTALADAEAFKKLFEGTFERWEIAGSVRRRKLIVGDIEHVVIPKLGEIPAEDLFKGSILCNLMLRRCDELLSAGIISRHVYSNNAHGAPMHRWGEKYRGCDFRGFNHEIFCAEEEGWGSTLAIRTGPAELSRQLVTNLHVNYLRQYDGHVWQCESCPNLLGVCAKSCEFCHGTKLRPMQIIPTPTEEIFFGLAGMAWIEPEKRN